MKNQFLPLSLSLLVLFQHSLQAESSKLKYENIITSLESTSILIDELENKASQERENKGKNLLIEELESKVAAYQNGEDGSMTPTMADSDRCCDSSTSSIYDWRPNPNCSAYYIRGEFLYWRTLEDNVEFASKGQPPINDLPVGDPSVIGKYYAARYDSDPGLRIALGYRFCPNFYEGEVEYTYFHNSGKQTVSGPEDLTDGGLLISAFPQGFAGSPTANYKVQSSIKLNYNLLNFYLAKQLYVCDYLIFRLFTGPSGFWVKQDWTIDYLSTNQTAQIEADWDYSAGGVRFGLSSEWLLGCGIGIFTQLSFGGYVGSYDNYLKNRQIFVSPESNRIIQNSRIHETRYAYNIQFLLGPSWGKTFCNWAMNLFVGYEINPWFNLHMLEVPSDQSNPAPLGSNGRVSVVSNGLVIPQGLTVRASVEF